MEKKLKTYFHNLKESPSETIKSLPYLFLIMLLQFIGLVVMTWTKMKKPFLVGAGIIFFFGVVIYIVCDQLPIILAPSILEFIGEPGI